MSKKKLFEDIKQNPSCIYRTPADVLRTLSAAFDKIFARTEVQEKLAQMGIEPLMKSGAELRAFSVSERTKWGKLIQAAKITAD
mgnify:CR=1 FL=1